MDSNENKLAAREAVEALKALEPAKQIAERMMEAGFQEEEDAAVLFQVQQLQERIEAAESAQNAKQAVSGEAELELFIATRYEVAKDWGVDPATVHSGSVLEGIDSEVNRRIRHKAVANERYQLSLKDLAEKLCAACNDPLPQTAKPGYAMALAIQTINRYKSEFGISATENNDDTLPKHDWIYRSHTEVNGAGVQVERWQECSICGDTQNELEASSNKSCLGPKP